MRIRKLPANRLHLGHALNNTLQDVLIRWRRMAGDNAVWLPGTDHAGIATQTVVEKRVLAEEGKRRTDFQRDEFVAKIQAWKDEYEATITDQLKAMGCSCDWDRQAFTMDDQRAKAVREAFFQLFRDGLIYRGKRLVNWDPATQTALADDEVEMETIDGHFWYMRYPVVDSDEYVTVATTRPETMLGDTAVAVNPNDPERAKFIGRHVRLPIVNRLIPVVGDDYVVKPDPDSSDEKARFASGFLKVTPAHDPNDYEIGQRHDLPVINVMAPDGSISKDHGWPPEEWEQGTHDEFLENLLGMDRYEAREAIVEWFRQNDLLAEVKPYTHTVGHSYRSHVAIEPYLSDQWYVQTSSRPDRPLPPEKDLAQIALQAMAQCDEVKSEIRNPKSEIKGRVRFTPARYAKTFQTWHENIRDWCISRQLWWGHRIPVWHIRFKFDGPIHPSGEDVALDDIDARHAIVDQLLKALPTHKPVDYFLKYDEASMSGFLVSNSPDMDRLLAETEQMIANPSVSAGDRDVRQAAGTLASSLVECRQDPDVLDTWFSSALWPMSTLGWPDDTAELARWNPTSVLSTAREIITLWVSRMVMFNVYFRGCVPFTDVFIHAMIQDGEGRKMSKSLGNGVDPLDIIHSHGSDAMRFTLVQMTTQTQDVRMPVERDEATGKNTSPKFDIGRNFANKLWNAGRFALGILGEAPGQSPRSSAVASRGLADRWILSRLHQTIAAVDDALRGFNFNHYAQTVYDFFWRDLCDWYLEAIKPVARQDSEAGAAARATLGACLDATLRLLHPIMPYITEKLWSELNDVAVDRSIEGLSLEPNELCIQAAWPTAGEVDRESIETFEVAEAVTSLIRELRAGGNIPPRDELEVSIKTLAATPAQVEAGQEIITTLANAKIVTIGAELEKPENAATAVHAVAEVYLHREIDAGVERERLSKRLGELENSRKALSGRLANKGYTEKAPAHLVQETRDQLASVENEIATVEKTLAGLN
jgi:valyl-tRNA synthetase